MSYDPAYRKAYSKAQAEAIRWIQANHPETWQHIRVNNGLPRQGRIGTPALPREHGTPRGYEQHRYRNEPACNQCRTAHNQHQRNKQPI